MRRNARALAASFTLLSLWQLSEAMVSVVGGGLFNHALAGGSVGALLIWGGLLILMFTRSMCTCRYGVLSAYRVDRVEANRLRAAIAHHILGPRGAHTERLPGVALSLANGNADDGGTLSRTVSITFASAVSVRSS
ncbi:hypothetical protein [Nonomuraea jabiensis]|uniref:hypothetical protein n=1 Tax=Nonomuraea jabiensis TaxID=882448 RepID=UPI003D74DDDE